MSDLNNIKTQIRLLNIIEVLGIQLIVIVSLGFQVFLHDLPCPLCLLQRVGFFGIALGLLMNLRFGMHPIHYSVVLLNALFTSFVALRQFALNAGPEGGYGNPFLGLHLYTWSFIIATLILISTALLLGIERQYQSHLSKKMQNHWSTRGLIVVTIFIFILNLGLLIFKCGFKICH